MRDDEYEAPSGGDELIPMAPREALDIWLDRQQMDKAESTVESYRYRVEPFVEFLEDEEGVENLNHLNGRHLLRFDSMRRSSGDVQKNTLNNQLGTIRQFLESERGRARGRQSGRHPARLERRADQPREAADAAREGHPRVSRSLRVREP